MSSGDGTIGRLRILQVLEPRDGGVVLHAQALARGLVRRGHTVHAAVTDRGAAAEALLAAGAGVTRGPLVPSIAAPREDARALRWLLRVMAGEYDVVHTHQSKAGALGRPAARARGLPVVHSPHGFAYVTQDRRGARFPGAKRALTLGVERALAPLTARIICVSQYDRDAGLRDGVAGAARFTVVPNGVDVERLAAARPEPALLGAGPLVGYLGRLEPEKDPLAFARAVSGMPGARAVVIGNGSLRREVEATGIAVRPFAGDVAPALAAFDVYVLPSRWESLSLGALEAMAAGVPVISTDVGGMREAVRHEETGLLVPPGDAEALRAAIERLVRDRPLRERLGRRAAEVAALEYSVELMVQRTETVYLEVVAGA